MKQTFAILTILSILFSSCTSTYVDKNDYDSETYEYISENEREYLGQFSYTGFTYSWHDFSDYQLSDTIQNAAVKKYGKKILLRNITLTAGKKSMVIATIATATAGFAMGIAGSEEKITTDKYGYEKEETELNGLGVTGAVILCASPIFTLFKKYTITADVYKNETNYKPQYLLLTETENIENAQRLAKLNQEANLRYKKEQERIASRIANHEIWVGMSKEDLIKSRGEPKKSIVKDDGTTSEAAGVSAGLSAIYGYSSSSVSAGAAKSTTKINRVQVYYYPDVEIYIKDNVVSEIYDIKN